MLAFMWFASRHGNLYPRRLTMLARRLGSAVKVVLAVLAAMLAASSGPISADQPPAGRAGGEDPGRFPAGAIDNYLHRFSDNTHRSGDGVEAGITARTGRLAVDRAR